MLNFDFCSIDDILMKRRALKRQLSGVEDLKELRIAILGGSTTEELVNLLEILLLSSGFRPVFHQSHYGRFYEEAVHDPQDLIHFAPDLVYIHTSFRNAQNTPPLNCIEAALPGYVEAELSRYRDIWDALQRNLNCLIIQNNFELPPYAILGNLDAVASGGQTRFLLLLNVAFAAEANRRPKLLLQDVHSLSTQMGLKHWFDWDRFFSYKLLLTAEANLALARSINALVKALYGRSRKVLVLDLDNTLWGGIIGDDGLEKIQIGRETPVAEAYTAFQEYCLALRHRGVLLAVCSKNNEEVAKSGLEHPSSVLKLEHISCFKANWEPKPQNILAIAQELNLGVESFVFVDDNPAERMIVKAQLPEVAVPDVGSEVSRFITIIEQGRYFEPVSLSREDLERASLYANNSQRTSLQNKYADYGEYLDSLEMVAEIDVFQPVYLERIAQLTNKTNQFNLTTRHYTLAELEIIARSDRHLALFGRLADRFGDNGLISIIVGRKEADALHIDLWLMSCRVLKRDMEIAMLDAITERAGEMGVKTIVGYYLPTNKNGMVSDFYPKLGFRPHSSAGVELPPGSTLWAVDLADYVKQNRHIKVLEYVNA